jgi:hypothetical protein
MPKILHVSAHLTDDELRARAEGAEDPDERLRWMAIRQKMQGRSPTLIADFCNRKPDWVRRVVRRYNAEGPDSVADRRVGNGHSPLLDGDGLAALEQALEHETPPGGGLWNGPKVALWIGARVGERIHPRTGWYYLRYRLNWSIKVPLQAHPDSDESAKEAFKKGGSPPRSGASRRAILTPQ